MPLAWPTVIFFSTGWQCCRISHEYSSFFHHSNYSNLIFVFSVLIRLNLGAIMRAKHFMYLSNKNYIGT